MTKISVPFPSGDEDTSLKKLKSTLRHRLDSDSAERERKLSDKENTRNVLRKPRKERSPSLVDSVASTTADRTLVEDDSNGHEGTYPKGKAREDPESLEGRPALGDAKLDKSLKPVDELDEGRADRLPTLDLAGGTPEDPQPVPSPKGSLPSLRVPILNVNLEPPGFVTAAAGEEPTLVNLAGRLVVLPLSTAFAIAGRFPIVGPYAPASHLKGRSVLAAAIGEGAGLMVAGGWTVASWLVGVKA